MGFRPKYEIRESPHKIPQFQKSCIALVRYPQTSAFLYSQKKYYIWFSQIERIKTYKGALTLWTNPVSMYSSLVLWNLCNR